MCGRFTLTVVGKPLADLFGVAEPDPPLPPRFNIAPTQSVAAVRTGPGTEQRELTFLRWGLIPSWARDLRQLPLMINARAETVTDKPTFRTLVRQRRCLIPADGLYEWQKQGNAKQPFHIRLVDGTLFALAGLWDRWLGPDGTPVESCTILTTQANDLVRPIHDRMPVILSPEHHALWLDPQVQDESRLRPLLCPFPEGAMRTVAVGRQVNSPRHDGPDCLTPLVGLF